MDPLSQCIVDRRSSAGLRWAMTEKKKPRAQGPKHTKEERAALAQSLTKAREPTGYTQESAAIALGFSGKQAVNSWEKARNLPDAIWLRKLARLYRTTTDSLVGHAPLGAEAMTFAAQFDQLKDHQQAAIKALLSDFRNTPKVRLVADSQQGRLPNNDKTQAAGYLGPEEQAGGRVLADAVTPQEPKKARSHGSKTDHGNQRAKGGGGTRGASRKG